MKFTYLLFTRKLALSHTYIEERADARSAVCCDHCIGAGEIGGGMENAKNTPHAASGRASDIILAQSDARSKQTKHFYVSLTEK
jgi:hypothetical protein